MLYLDPVCYRRDSIEICGLVVETRVDLTQKVIGRYVLIEHVPAGVSIGYSVEGATDRAFLEGLRRRWLPDARLIEGAFRGASGISLRRDIPRICLELDHKSADVIVFLTDADEQNWRQVRKRESEFVPPEFHHRTVYGVADRNVECWLAADRAYLAR